jgi:predicted MFS family arabinose efflux permease
VSIVLWSIASLAAAFAGSYSSLLLTRAALGAVTATAGPVIASLTGGYFPARERAQIYAYILSGEVAGSAVGYIISESVASLIDRRAAFVVLAIPGFFLARTLWRTVPEPLRGGQSHLDPGVVELGSAPAVAEARADDARVAGAAEASQREREAARAAARRAGAVADLRRVLKDPRQLSLAAAVRYSLSVPSNLMMIVGTSLGYLYYQGRSAFALLFVEGHYHAGQAAAELVLAVLVAAAVIGTLISGRLTDLMRSRGMLKARVSVPAACYVFAAILLVPGFTGSSLTPALWFDVAGVALISAANPPIQVARLDIMPAALWGRAESTRTAVRSLAQPIASTLFRRGDEPGRRHRGRPGADRNAPPHAQRAHRHGAGGDVPDHAGRLAGRRRLPRPRSHHLRRQRRHGCRLRGTRRLMPNRSRAFGRVNPPARPSAVTGPPRPRARCRGR